MNVFLNTLVARDYNDYYQTDIEKATDKIEKIILSGHFVHVSHGNIFELGLEFEYTIRTMTNEKKTNFCS